MSEQKKPQEPEVFNVPITAADLLKVMESMQQRHTQELTTALASQKENLLASIKELKHDPIAEEKKKNAVVWREQMRASQEEQKHNEELAQDGCTHQRKTPGGGMTYKIAWMGFADKIPRGVCQICQKMFDPNMRKDAEGKDYIWYLRNTTEGVTIQI